MSEDTNKKKRRILQPQTVRERAEKTALTGEKPRRLSQTARGVAKPFKAAAGFGRREYYLPMPDNKFGRFLNKRRYVIPAYFRNSWKELRQVVWPDRKETWKLTLAVFMFAIIFSFLISLTDFGLDKFFRKVILKI